MARRLRVLHAQKVAGIAGSENHLLTLLPELRKSGCKAEMLVLADGRDQPQEFLRRMRLNGVPTYTESLIGDIDPTIIARLGRMLRKRGYNIVHTHLVHADLYAGLAARLQGSGLVISTRHNDDAFRSRLPIRPLLKLGAKLSDHFICISEWVREFSRTHEGIPADRSTTIHYGLHPSNGASQATLMSDLVLPPRVPILGTVARLTPQKGHSTLLHAFRAVLESFPEARLVLVGDGDLKDDLRRLIGDLDLTRNIHMLGYRADAAQLMRGFDLLVHPSRWEGFGLVLLEAMAAALPIVATRVSAIPEVVCDGETGLLVPPDDSNQLAIAICRCLSNPEWAKRLGRAGEMRLKADFSVSSMVRKTLLVYEEALNRKQASQTARADPHDEKKSKDGSDEAITGTPSCPGEIRLAMRAPPACDGVMVISS